jgi:hypothetical protein
MGLIYMSNTSNSMNTTKDSSYSSVFNFDDDDSVDMTVNDDNIAEPNFGNIPPIQHENFPDSATALSEAATPFAANNHSYYDDYEPLNDLPMTIEELNTSGNTQTSNLNRTDRTDEESLPSLQSTLVSSFGNSGFSGTNSSVNSGSFGNSVNSGTNSFGGSRITFGGKKVKKTALDELIKDMNRITYILKGIKIERKVIKKKSKKNKNKKKRTYKKIKKIPRNNRKRSVKKSKK